MKVTGVSRSQLCSAVAAVALLVLGSLLAAGHGHHRVQVDRVQVDAGDCAVCHLQQTKGFQRVGVAALVSDLGSEACGLSGCEHSVLVRKYLLEPLRGPPDASLRQHTV